METYKSLIDDLSVRYDHVRRQAKEEVGRLGKAEERSNSVVKAQRHVQAVAQTMQQRAHEQVAGVVSRCLEAMFDDPYEFKILFEQKRGKTEARIVFGRDGVEVEPMSASGGGVVDVAAFALRLASLVLSRPPCRRVLVMDEPFKFLSEGYRSRVGELLEVLSEEMDIQFIMITHDDALRMGSVVEIGKKR